MSTEHLEQVAFFQWAALHTGRWPELERMLYAIPNGGGRSKPQAGMLKAEGVKRGVPDVFLSIPRGGYHGLYIEFKCRDTGGSLRPEQRDFIAKARDLGYAAEVAWTCEEAIAILSGYMAANPPWTWAKEGA